MADKTAHFTESDRIVFALKDDGETIGRWTFIHHGWFTPGCDDVYEDATTRSTLERSRGAIIDEFDDVIYIRYLLDAKDFETRLEMAHRLDVRRNPAPSRSR